jgi:signal transduction histidine kinase
MPAEREQPSGLIDTAELADLIAHEVNNLLNSIVLHAALLERSLPQEVKTTVQAELGVMRQAINRAGTMLRRWQQIGPKPAATLEAVDLNQAIRDLPLPDQMRGPAGTPVSVQFQPGPRLPRVLGNKEDMNRLVTLLVRSAAHASPERSTITVKTESAPGQVLLSVEDQGAEIDPDLLERVFEPFAGLRDSLFASSEEEQLWLATCKVLSRRQKATITAAPGSAGGLRITVRFTVAPTDQ